MLVRTPPQQPAAASTVTAAQAARYVEAELNSVYARMLHAHRELYRRAWLSQTYTPAEYFAAMGTNGGETLDAVEALAIALEALKPGTMAGKPMARPLGVATTTAEDGTVTVGG